MNLPLSPVLVRLLASLFALSLLAAACGDSDAASDDVASDAGDDASADAADDASADESGDDEDTDDTDDSVDDGADDASDDMDVDSGDGDIELYCQLSAEADEKSDSFINFMDPVAFEEFVGETRSAIAAAIPLAPSAIRADLSTLADGFEELASTLEAVDYQFAEVIDELEAISDAPDQVAAQERVDAFEQEFCGFPADDAEDGDAPDENIAGDDAPTAEQLEALLGSETGRELFIQGMTQDGQLTAEQATCMVDNLDFEALAALAGDVTDPSPESMADFLSMMDTCGIDPNALG